MQIRLPFTGMQGIVEERKKSSMILCSKCGKRPAVVFVSPMSSSGRSEGYCLTCAKELNIPQVSEYLKNVGISDEDLAEMSDQMMEFMQENDETEETMGNISAMPNFLRNLFSAPMPAQNAEQDEKKSASAEEPKRSRSNPFKKKKEEEKEYKFLNNYCTNLSQRAAEGKLDRIIGRDREIARVVQILSRRQKNNPCLIGEPGVGKTAIAEGIAQRIASGDVPFHLRDKKIFLLDLTALVAGTQFRGQFESRVKGLIGEVVREGNIILFIDEVHNLVGAGDSEGSMNAANILKPALSRGEVQVIGATTFKEYRKYIEKDSALERRFQPVTVKEPTVEETAEVLLGIREYYSEYHRVKISDRLLRMCAVLSERYITDRFLPDKAIDLLDESCAYRSIRASELRELDEATAKYDAEKAKLSALEEQETPDFEKIAEMKAACSRLEMQVKHLQEQVEKIEVEESDLAAVIELWTGIPANKIEETELSRMRNLADRLKTRVVGQDEAVDALANAIKRTRVQLSKRIRPASFIFVGPTGVGKTELVKVLAAELFDAADPLIRLDMTEFMEKHAVARMIGSPPGYVGYDEAGQLTEKVRRNPYSVILFDEIEKAHPDVMNILMQILDEGQIEDAQGRTVNFSHTVICMTSNAGSTDKTTGVGFNRSVEEISKDKAMKALRDFLRPEFISRIDEIIVFHPLGEPEFAKIAGLMMEEMRDPLAEKGIRFNYDEAALQKIAAEAFGKRYGARDIRRIIREKVEDAIARAMIDEGRKLTEITVTANEQDISVSFA